MPTSLNKYLDPAALDETVVNIRQIVEDLPYARPDGLYSDMTVGAVIGADDTAQWATRESTGSGTAIVRSVQGAVDVQDSELVPVRIAGIASTDAQGGELDGVEWPTFTLRGAGAIGDMLYSDHVETRVGVVVLNGRETWQTGGAAYDGTSGTDRFTVLANGLTNTDISFRTNVKALGFNSVTNTWANPDANVGNCALYCAGDALQIHFVFDNATVGITTDMTSTQRTNAIRAWIAQHPIEVYYPIVPTTTLISTALNFTYRVQAGGSEAIIVPAGEVSAAPVLTVAEPVNMSTELARIWAAIESLGYTRNTAQLSRPVSLTDIGSIDEVQNDTTEIDTVKEVKE